MGKIGPYTLLFRSENSKNPETEGEKSSLDSKGSHTALAAMEEGFLALQRLHPEQKVNPLGYQSLLFTENTPKKKE